MSAIQSAVRFGRRPSHPLPQQHQGAARGEPALPPLLEIPEQPDQQRNQCFDDEAEQEVCFPRSAGPMKNWAYENSILRNAVRKIVLANRNANRMPQSDGARMTRSLAGGLIEADEPLHIWENLLGSELASSLLPLWEKVAPIDRCATDEAFVSAEANPSPGFISLRSISPPSPTRGEGAAGPTPPSPASPENPLARAALRRARHRWHRRGRSSRE